VAHFGNNAYFATNVAGLLMSKKIAIEIHFILVLLEDKCAKYKPE